MHDKVLDVSELAAPEPLERVLAALKTLDPGARLRVLHHREPLLLYDWLREHGYEWSTQPGRTTAFEILIWRAGESGTTAQP